MSNEKIMKKEYHTMTISLTNINQAQAIALKKMFEYMEYLGNIGSSRMCSFFADGDGDFRPKVSFDYPEELPEMKEIDCIVRYNEDSKRFSKEIRTSTNDFIIDYDEIAWKIYH